MRLISFLLAVVLILQFSSCTVEKRRYLDGYHVEWHHKSKGMNKIPSKELSNSQPTFSDVASTQDETTKEPSLNISSLEINTPVEVSDIEPISVFNEVKMKSSTHDKIEKHVLTSAIDKKVVKKSIRPKQSHARFMDTSSAHVFNVTHHAPVSDLVLLIIALFVSPLAVLLHEGRWNKTCWINLFLFLLFILPGIIHAFIVILV